VADEKKYLRAILTDCRAAITAECAFARSQDIARRLLAAHFYRRARTVLLYASKDNEVSTESILADALASRKIVMLPRYDRARRRFEAARITALEELAPGAFGILEPSADAPPASPGDLSGALVCVPGVAFGKVGQRLGRGQGHYDRFLAEFCAEAITVGLAYSFQLLDRIPEDSFDRRLNLIVTESAVISAADANARPRDTAGQGGTPGWP